MIFDRESTISQSDITVVQALRSLWNHPARVPEGDANDDDEDDNDDMDD